MRVPPSCNTGGKSPEICVDWCRFSLSGSITWRSLELALSDVFFLDVELRHRERGFLGYERSADVVVAGSDRRVGVVGYGGEAQRNRITVDLPGEGCKAACDWLPVVWLLEQFDGKLTRVDLCLDCESVSVRSAVRAYRRGEFNGDGRRPVGKLVDDLGNATGKTLYVGARSSAKLCRVYEKGLQLAPGSGSPWVRIEVEFKSTDCVIPFAFLVDRAAAFRSAYPFTARVCDELGVEESESLKVARSRREALSYIEHAIATARRQVGGAVRFLAVELGLPSSQIIGRIMADRTARRYEVASINPWMRDNFERAQQAEAEAAGVA